MHTPGPWVVECDGKGRPAAINAPSDAGIPGAVGHVVRWRGIGFPSSKTADANARLISAAPDLLAALQELLPHCGWRNLTDDELRWESYQGNGMAPIIRRARAAIFKATGEQP